MLLELLCSFLYTFFCPCATQNNSLNYISTGGFHRKDQRIVDSDREVVGYSGADAPWINKCQEDLDRAAALTYAVIAGVCELVQLQARRCTMGFAQNTARDHERLLTRDRRMMMGCDAS